MYMYMYVHVHVHIHVCIHDNTYLLSCIIMMQSSVRLCIYLDALIFIYVSLKILSCTTCFCITIIRNYSLHLNWYSIIAEIINKF